MPILKQAVKRMRADKKRKAMNMGIQSELKTLTKKANILLADKKAAEAKKMIVLLSSKLARAAKKNIIHKKTASRTTSRLMKRLHKLSAA